MAPNNNPISGGGLTPESVLSKLQQLLQDVLNLESTDSLGRDARLREDLNVDSLAFVDLVMALEEGFGLKIGTDSDLIKQVHTVGDLADMILSMSDASV